MNEFPGRRNLSELDDAIANGITLHDNVVDAQGGFYVSGNQLTDGFNLYTNNLYLATGGSGSVSMGGTTFIDFNYGNAHFYYPNGNGYFLADSNGNLYCGNGNILADSYGYLYGDGSNLTNVGGGGGGGSGTADSFLSNSGDYETPDGAGGGFGHGNSFGNYSFAFGQQNSVSGALGGYALGYQNTLTTSNGGVAVGYTNSVSGQGSLAIGNSLTVTEANVVSIGASSGIRMDGGLITTNNAGKFTAKIVVSGSYASGSRPSASTNPGAVIQNTTLNKLQYSNGTTWETITSS